jgi:predicted ATPase
VRLWQTKWQRGAGQRIADRQSGVCGVRAILQKKGYLCSKTAMLTLIEVKNFRVLKYIEQPLAPFQILVGANASGKTTFLDTVSFVSDIISIGIDQAITKRSSNFLDLTWANQGGDVEIALEFQLPREIQSLLGENKGMDKIRYEIKVGLHREKEEFAILGERALLMRATAKPYLKHPELFPDFQGNSNFVLEKEYQINEGQIDHKTIINKRIDGNDSFYPEKYGKPSIDGWLPSFKLGHKKSALANLPADDEKFPATNWLKEYLQTGIQVFMLNSLKIREASRPGQGRNFQNDGSNLPWIIENLERNEPALFQDWIKHLRTALPDLQGISIHEIPDNKHKYLKIQYQSDIQVPSWMVSDGTLRLLALTLIAYLPNFKGTYLIEEPENGIHPKAMESIFQSLSSVYDAQILLASHSPVFLSIAALKDVLCFAKTAEGIADIVNGASHPRLRNWKGDSSLGVLFAGGILG